MAIRGLEGNMQAQPRVFAHDATNASPSGVAVGAIADTETRGCCIYIGRPMDITVALEGSTGNVIFKGLAAGSFLPILATSVISYTLDASDTDPKADWDVVALF